MTRPDSASPPLATWVLTVLALIVALAVFVGTDRSFSVLEDETAIVVAARSPLAETAELFWSGQGQHEHPPLSDVLLHVWLPVGGAAQWSLRLPSVVFYLAGLVFLALSARMIAGASAFTAVLAIGLLSPFGFHFGRLIGWYSFCFFLVAVVTWTYLRYAERPTPRRLTAVLLSSLCLIYSNYYGWAIIFCIGIDLLAIRRQKNDIKALLIIFVTLIISYTPIWITFVKEVVTGTSGGAGLSPTAKLVNAVYNFYALFVSEAVAPWFWSFSVPAAVCIAASIVSGTALLAKERRWFLYFALLFGVMAVLGIVNTKRLLFISDWLLLGFAIAVSSKDRKFSRVVLIAALGGASAIGWIGIVARQYYAAPHFVEPWSDIADEAAALMKSGGVVVSNSPSFFFDLNYSLERLGMVSRAAVPGWAEHPLLFNVANWDKAADLKLSAVLFVRGVNTTLTGQTDATETWLKARCVLESERALVPDSGAALKARFFPDKKHEQPAFRIVLQRFDCSRPPS
jgi:hypothetical protein